MDYLLYLSEPKVEMLYSQLDPPLAQQLAAELGANVGVASFKIKTTAPSLGLYAKARCVEAHVEKTYGFGTLASPAQWVRDELDVIHIDTAFSEGMFALVGKSGNDYFLLGGSARNMIGNSNATLVRSPLSYLPHFLEAFREGFVKWERSRDTRMLWVDERPSWAQEKLHHGGSRDELAWSIRELFEQSRGALAMSVKFVARRLASEALGSIKGEGHVYTPLYVAQIG